MAASPRPPWWSAWRPGWRAETTAIALLILGLTALTLVAGYRVYLAGLTALSRPGQPVVWLVAPGEVGLGLMLGLAGGGWLAGVWLGERRRRGWPLPGLLVAALALPLTNRLYDALGVADQPRRFALTGLAPDLLWPFGSAVLALGLLLGSLAGAWWASLGPGDER